MSKNKKKKRKTPIDPNLPKEQRLLEEYNRANQDFYAYRLAHSKPNELYFGKKIRKGMLPIANSGSVFKYNKSDNVIVLLIDYTGVRIKYADKLVTEYGDEQFGKSGEGYFPTTEDPVCLRVFLGWEMYTKHFPDVFEADREFSELVDIGFGNKSNRLSLEVLGRKGFVKNVRS